MPSVYDFHHIELNNIGRGKKRYVRYIVIFFRFKDWDIFYLFTKIENFFIKKMIHLNIVRHYRFIWNQLTFRDFNAFTHTHFSHIHRSVYSCPLCSD